MDPGYDVEPRPVGHSTHRGASVVVLVAAILLGVALLKPWAAQPTPDSKAVIVSPAPLIASPAPFASSEFALIPIRPDAQRVPVWPAQSVPSLLADATATQAESVLGRLTIHSGQWGVGNAGVGPRMLRDEPWTDWVAAVPETVDQWPAPRHDLAGNGPSAAVSRRSTTTRRSSRSRHPRLSFPTGASRDGGPTATTSRRYRVPSARSHRQAIAASAISNGPTVHRGRPAATSSMSSPARARFR